MTTMGYKVLDIESVGKVVRPFEPESCRVFHRLAFSDSHKALEDKADIVSARQLAIDRFFSDEPQIPESFIQEDVLYLPDKTILTKMRVLASDEKRMAAIRTMHWDSGIIPSNEQIDRVLKQVEEDEDILPEYRQTFVLDGSRDGRERIHYDQRRISDYPLTRFLFGDLAIKMSKVEIDSRKVEIDLILGKSPSKGGLIRQLYMGKKETHNCCIDGGPRWYQILTIGTIDGTASMTYCANPTYGVLQDALDTKELCTSVGERINGMMWDSK